MFCQWLAVTFSERTPTTNPFLTNNKKIRDRHVHRTRHKHGRRSYLSDGIGGDSQSLLEREPLRSKYRGLLSCFFDRLMNMKGMIPWVRSNPILFTYSFLYCRLSSRSSVNIFLKISTEADPQELSHLMKRRGKLQSCWRS